MILHSDTDKFLNDCMCILKKLGELKPDLYILGQHVPEALLYEDELIRIIMSTDGMWGEMERKANRNPFFMKYNGDIIRFHGEYAYLDDHINKLLRK